MLVNKTSHKFTGKLGQKVDKTKCGHNYKIILRQVTSISLVTLTLVIISSTSCDADSMLTIMIRTRRCSLIARVVIHRLLLLPPSVILMVVFSTWTLKYVIIDIFLFIWKFFYRCIILCKLETLTWRESKIKNSALNTFMFRKVKIRYNTTIYSY